MGSIAYSLGHLFLGLHLHVHITGTRLDGTHQKTFCLLHGTYLAALQRKILQRRIIGHDIRYPACSHEGYIGREHFVYILHGQGAAVKTDFGHFAPFQCLKNTFQVLIYYCCTDHNSFSV